MTVWDVAACPRVPESCVYVDQGFPSGPRGMLFLVGELAAGDEGVV